MQPAPSYNIASLPHVDDREPLEKTPGLALELARGKGYLGLPRHGWRETLAVDTATGRIDHIVILPGNSLLPLGTALVTGSFFLLMLLKLYIWTLVPLAALFVLGWRWAWVLGGKLVYGPLPVGHDREALIHAEVQGSPGWWGSAWLHADVRRRARPCPMCRTSARWRVRGQEMWTCGGCHPPAPGLDVGTGVPLR